MKKSIYVTLLTVTISGCNPFCKPIIWWDQPRKLYWVETCTTIIGRANSLEGAEAILAEYNKNPSRKIK